MKKKEIERLAVMETQVKNINEKLDRHTEDQRKDFDRLFETLEQMNTKFAGKWVEKVSIGTIITAIGVLLTLLLMH